MRRELVDLIGLSAQVTAALADTYRGPWTCPPGAVFADLAAAVADGADCIDGVGQRCGGLAIGPTHQQQGRTAMAGRERLLDLHTKRHTADRATLGGRSTRTLSAWIGVLG